MTAIPDRIPFDWSGCKFPLGQRKLLELVESEWAMYAYWLAYMRSGLGNPRERPYSLAEFRDRKSFAEVLNAEFDLCRGVLECSPSLPYATPYVFAMACFDEYKQWRYNASLGLYDALPKRKRMQGLRGMVKHMEARKNPYTRESNQLHHYRLIRRAIRLRDTPSFNRRYWIPYLASWKAHIKDVDHNKRLKAAFSSGEEVMLIEKSNYKRALKMRCPETLAG